MTLRTAWAAMMAIAACALLVACGGGGEPQAQTDVRPAATALPATALATSAGWVEFVAARTREGAMADPIDIGDARPPTSDDDPTE